MSRGDDDDDDSADDGGQQGPSAPALQQGERQTALAEGGDRDHGTVIADADEHDVADDRGSDQRVVPHAQQAAAAD